jgi:hypothetical protein
VICGATLTVEYTYVYDPGVWTYRNGDPGYPACEDISIISIKTNDCIFELLDSTKDLIEEIETKISEHETSEREE